MSRARGSGESVGETARADRHGRREIAVVSTLLAMFALVGAVIPLSERYGAKCSESGAIVFRLTGDDVEADVFEPTESVEHRRNRCVTEANLRIAVLALNVLFVLASRHHVLRAPSGLLSAGLALTGFGDVLLIFAGLAGELQGFRPRSEAPCGGDDVICKASPGVLPFALALIGSGLAVAIADFGRQRRRDRPVSSCLE